MRYWMIFITLLLSGLLSGCGLSTPVHIAPARTYALSAVLPTPSSDQHQVASVLMVAMPISAAGYETNHIVYQPLPFDLRHYANHQWVAPPVQMLMPLITQAIRNQGYFKAVVMVPFTGQMDYVLETQLIALKQSFLKPNSVQYVIIQATLIDSHSHTVIANKRFTVAVNAPGNDAYSGVVAANAGVSQLTAQLASWVVSAAHRSRH